MIILQIGARVALERQQFRQVCLPSKGSEEFPRRNFHCLSSTGCAPWRGRACCSPAARDRSRDPGLGRCAGEPLRGDGSGIRNALHCRHGNTLLSKPGSPPEQGPLTAAERMHRYRARRRAAGLKQERRWVPVRPESVAVYSDHCIVEARSLALHCVIARKIFRRPALLDVARRNLAAWKRARADAERPRCLDEWEQILRRPWPEIAAFITATSAHAARLRQSSPFAGVLDRHERKRVYEAFRA